MYVIEFFFILSMNFHLKLIGPVKGVIGLNLWYNVMSPKKNLSVNKASVFCLLVDFIESPYWILPYCS